MRYEFGPFQLDTETLILRRGQEPIPITPKALQILRFLVENAGRVVPKEEILTSVWADITVEEANLTQNIFALRRILGEKPRDHRFIATVPGKGYRFVAEVKPCGPSTSANELSSRLSVPSEAKLSSRIRRTGSVLCSLVIGGGARQRFTIFRIAATVLVGGAI